MAERPAARDLPTGIVTFMFTDIEGSTRLLQALGEQFPGLLATHHELLRRAIGDHGGIVLGTEGDAFFAVFAAPQAAVGAATQAQRSLWDAQWPEGSAVRVRMGMHTGQGTPGGDNYVGIDVHRAARIAGAAHGGQVVISEQTRVLVDRALPSGVSVRDLGTHRLKDLDQPEHLHQLDIEGLPTEFPALRSIDGRLHNLPRPLTSLVGRDREIGEVRALVDHQRLVTLLGAGGAGKTRLAIAVAEESLDGFQDGAAFAGLDSIREPALVPSAIALAVGVKETRDETPLEAVSSSLAGKELLLVLDNFEQIGSAAPVVEALLAAAPGLRVLVTSRTPLHLYGEQQYRVPPLGLPDVEPLPPIDELGAYEAIALFVDRARMASPRFSLGADNAPAVAAIVVRLDALPLAIELAAARSNLLSPQQMLKRLDQRLALPSSGLASLPERQRSLRATIEWSHDQLSPAERVLFRRLSVFEGGCTVAAIEAVCNADRAVGPDVLDPISGLVDASLLRQEAGADDDAEGDARFTSLETIREFASDKLVESSEAQALRTGHATHVLGLVLEAERGLRGKDQILWLDRLTRDRDNIRAALRWAAGEGDTGLGLRISAAVWRFWQLRGHLREGRDWVARLLAKPDAGADPRVLAAGITTAGNLAYWQGDMSVAQTHYERALEIDRELDDAARIADDVRNLGFMAMAGGDPRRAHDLFRESLERLENVGDRLQVADAQASLGMSEMLVGDIDAAKDLMQRALRVMLELGVLPRAADNSMGLSFMSLRGGDRPAAARYARQAIELVQGLGDRSRVPIVLDAAYAIALQEGSHEAGTRLAAAAAHLRTVIGGAVPSYFTDPAASLAVARQELGDAAFETAWSAGEGLDAEAAMAEALEALKASPQ